MEMGQLKITKHASLLEATLVRKLRPTDPPTDWGGYSVELQLQA